MVSESYKLRTAGEALHTQDTVEMRRLFVRADDGIELLADQGIQIVLPGVSLVKALAD